MAHLYRGTRCSDESADQADRPQRFRHASHHPRRSQTTTSTGLTQARGQRYNDKGQVLYHPVGPNLPAPHHGIPLRTRPPAQTPEADESIARGAV